MTYRSIATDPPPDGVRVLVAWSGRPFSPIIAQRILDPRGRYCWATDRGDDPPIPPDLWCELPTPDQKTIDNPPAK